MSRRDASPDSAGEINMVQPSIATTQASHLAQLSARSAATLLAQIPDLDDDDVDDPQSLLEEHTSGTAGRMISQSLANKLIIGGGVLLVVAAILPFTLAKKAQPKPGDGDFSQYNSPPAPDADAAPSWNDGSQVAAARDSSPMSNGPMALQPRVVIAATPNLPGQMPSVDANSQFPAVADRVLPTTVGMNRPMAIGHQGPGGVATGSVQPTVVQASGTDARRDADPQTDARQTAPPGDRPIYQADERNDQRNNYREAAQGDYRGSQAPVSPLMPDLNRGSSPQTNGTSSPPPAPPQQSSPDGAVQLDGGIIPIPPNQDHP